MELKWTIICFMGAMLILSKGENWMAGGTFTQADFATLRAKVDNFDKGTNRLDLAAAANTISDELNDLWAPAWNVAIVYYADRMNYDTVVYGYAFNGHWFWQNGLQLTDQVYISFIIWKDYNCVGWTTIQSQLTSYP